MENTKRCRTCGETKPATTEYFHKNRGGRYGLSSVCRPCRNEYLRQLRRTAKQAKQIKET